MTPSIPDCDDTIGPATPVLKIESLTVQFSGRRGRLVALDDVSLDIHSGETLGVVGESGAGKSLMGAAIIGLLPGSSHIHSGAIYFKSRRIDGLKEADFRPIRGAEIGAIFQDPLTSLNPLYTIGQQLVETIRTHRKLGPKEARAHALTLLQEVGIPKPEERFDHYPHQYSGGMRQRIVIALALCCGPSLLIADEPTTALDVSVQAQIIALLRRLSREQRVAIMLVTHDMGVIAESADRVAVMYAGRVVESGAVRDVLKAPRHPYTKGLMAAIPDFRRKGDRLQQIDGAMPRLTDRGEGCAFAPRCRQTIERCKAMKPPLTEYQGSQVACWNPAP